MAQLAVKNRLLLLITIALACLLAVDAVARHGLRHTNEAIEEIGVVRLPSVVGLDIVNQRKHEPAASSLRTRHPPKRLIGRVQLRFLG